MKAALIILMCMAVSMGFAAEANLTTPEQIKAASLAQCSPGTINSLDRDAKRKRDVLALKAGRISRGLLDAIFIHAAHEQNAKAYRAVGDAERAKKEDAAAKMTAGSAATAARKETLMANSDIIRAKAASQAPGKR